MTVYGIDLSHYQSGFSISQAESQGYRFFIFKCTEGTGYYDASYSTFVRDAKAAGVLVAAYHFLHAGNADAQAAHLAAHIGDKSIPVMIDAEAGGHPTWADIRQFIAGCKARGLRVTLNYLPHSYWSQIGSPSLVGTPAVVNAAYPSMKVGYGSVLYPGDNGSGWNSYGGVTPTLWQFSSSCRIDGYAGTVDVDAFRGTLVELRTSGLFRDFATQPVVVKPDKPAPKPPTPAPAPAPAPAPKPPVPSPKPPAPAPVPVPPKPAPKPSVGPVPFVFTTFNSQHTDTGSVGTPELREVIKASDVVNLNEIQSPWQRLVLASSPKFSMFPLLGAAGADPIMWRKSRFALVSTESTLAYKGESGVTPNAYVNVVRLRDKVTGTVISFINAHPPAHIENHGGAWVYTGADIKKYAHQLQRAQAIFASIAAKATEAKKLGPVVCSGDYNVGYSADKRAVAAGHGVPWFPYSLLVATAGLKPLIPPATHIDGRAIDWTLVSGLTQVSQRTGPPEASDHLPVYTTLQE